MAGSLTGRLRRGFLNQGWAHHRDGTQESWTSPNGAEVSVDAPPGTNLRVIEAHTEGKDLLVRAIDGDTESVIRGLAALHIIPEEVANAATA